MVKHPICHFIFLNHSSLYISLLLFFLDNHPAPLNVFPTVRISHPSVPVQSAWVPVLFQSGYTRGCCSFADDQQAVAVFIARMSCSHPSVKHNGTKFSSKHWSEFSSADYNLCLFFFFFWRDLIPDQCWRETPPYKELGSGEHIVKEELWEEQNTEDEAVAAC